MLALENPEFKTNLGYIARSCIKEDRQGIWEERIGNGVGDALSIQHVDSFSSS